MDKTHKTDSYPFAVMLHSLICTKLRRNRALVTFVGSRSKTVIQKQTGNSRKLLSCFLLLLLLVGARLVALLLTLLLSNARLGSGTVD